MNRPSGTASSHADSAQEAATAHASNGSSESSIVNSLLARVAPAEWAVLEEHVDDVDLAPRRVLFDAFAPMTHVYFPETAMISVVAGEGRRCVDASLIGRDGFLGLPVLLGAMRSAHRCVTHVAGTARRVKAAAFTRALESMPEFHALLLRYAGMQLEILSQSIACSSLHSIEQRFVRCLLHASDQVHSETVDLTHELMSQMLGARRAGVTVVAGRLQEAELIRYSRGRVRIVDRPRLESVACSCYGVVRNIRTRLDGQASGTT